MKSIHEKILEGLLPQGHKLTEKDIGCLLSNRSSFGVRISKMYIGSKVYAAKSAIRIEKPDKKG